MVNFKKLTDKANPFGYVYPAERHRIPASTVSETPRSASARAAASSDAVPVLDQTLLDGTYTAVGLSGDHRLSRLPAAASAC